MAAVRTNVVKDPVARAAYIDGVNGLKAEPLTNAQGQRVTTWCSLRVIRAAT